MVVAARGEDDEADLCKGGWHAVSNKTKDNIIVIITNNEGGQYQ